MKNDTYEYIMPAASHWSFQIRRGMQLTLTDSEGGANVGMLLYNPENLLERYNAPDTLKCQHTFKITKGNCLYSDMGRIFCSIVEDDFGWHDTVCGTSNKKSVSRRWGDKNYQQARNERHQNGTDSFLVELAKYGLSSRDIASNVNWFSQVSVDDEGSVMLDANTVQGQSVVIRFEMDTLIILHTCPHPLNQSTNYPLHPVKCLLSQAEPLHSNDICLNFCPENKRGFENNRIYYLGSI